AHPCRTRRPARASPTRCPMPPRPRLPARRTSPAPGTPGRPVARPPESRPNPAPSDRSRPVTSRTQSVEVLKLLAQPLFDVSLDHTADQPGHLDLAGQGDRAAVAVGLD